MRQTLCYIMIISLLTAFSCSSDKSKPNGDAHENLGNTAKTNSMDSRKDKKKPKSKKYYEAVVLKTIHHDSHAYTQGFFFHNGTFYEGTGQYGESSLRQLDAQSGEVMRQVPIPKEYFGEGIAMIGGLIYQLTWQDGICLVWDAETFELVKNLTYEGEGWGLTTDGTSLIFSDGSNRILFRNPNDLRIERTIYVFDGTKPQGFLNELEYIDGEIYANIFTSDEAVRIDPITGDVTARIDLSPLRKHLRPTDNVEVINGIAYDKDMKRLFATGKNWPFIYEISLKEK